MESRSFASQASKLRILVVMKPLLHCFFHNADIHSEFPIILSSLAIACLHSGLDTYTKILWTYQPAAAKRALPSDLPIWIRDAREVMPKDLVDYFSLNGIAIQLIKDMFFLLVLYQEYR